MDDNDDDEQEMRNGMSVDPDGTRERYIDGVLHRERGPAVEHIDGTRLRYRYNRLHWGNGPATEFPNGQHEY
jgi:hypothetical protein